MKRAKGRLTYNPHTGDVCKLVREGIKDDKRGWYVSPSVPKARWSNSRIFLYNDEIDVFSYRETVAWVMKVLGVNYKE